MATIALQVVGNLIYPGIGGAIGAGVGAVIDTVVGSALARKLLNEDAPIPDTPKNPGVDPGVPAPWVHGSSVRVPGTVIYVSETTAVPIPGKEDNEVVGYEYFVDVAIAWCRNVCGVDPVRKIWASSEVIYGADVTLEFDVDVYGITAEDRWEVFSAKKIKVEDGDPWCDGNRRARKRIKYRDQDMTWLALPGSSLDTLLDQLRNQLPGNDITITGCTNADNNGTFLLWKLEKLDNQYEYDGELYNVYNAVALRCGLVYPDKSQPCEPDPMPCDPAVTEVIEDGDPTNTITISANLVGFSRYFALIRNYTGATSGPITASSRPNVAADSIITGDPDVNASTVPAFRGTCYSAIERLNISKWAATLPQFEALIRERNTATPQTMIEALLARAEAEDAITLDTEPIDDGQTVILGIAVAGPASPSTQVREILNLYDIEVQEVQELLPNALLPTPVLRFSFQQDLPVIPVAYTSTSAREAGAKGRPHASLKRKTREDLPQELTFDYTDSTRDSQPNTSNYSVKTAPVVNRQKLATSLTLKPEDADVIARRLLWKAINFADSFEFETNARYFELVEGDRISMTPLPDGTALRGRITTITRGENGLLDVRGQVDDELAYAQVPGGGYSGGLPDGVVETAPPAFSIVLDIAPLSSSVASKFGVYLALQTSATTVTSSYGVFISLDETNWEQVASLSSPSIAGTARSVLGIPVDDNHWDEVNTVTVSLSNEAVLENRTREEVAGGYNWAFLGGEVIGFTTATLVPDPDNPHQEFYELSGLLRGRLDSSSYIPDHATGETFVLLPLSGVAPFIELDTSLFEQEVFVRTVPAGASVLDTVAIDTQSSFVPQAETLTPYSVHDVWSIRRTDYSTCVWATERTRVPFRLLSGVIPPKAESEDYSKFKADVYTLNGAMTDWVLRRQVDGCLCQNGQVCFNYSRAMVIADLVNTGVITGPENVGETLFVIYRESDTIGEGRPFAFCVNAIGPEFEGACSIDPPI